MQRLLVIDDEKIYQRMIAHALSGMDLQIEIADDGESGLSMAYRHPPDMVVCDVMMPKVDGYEVTRRLRRDPRFAYTPILILTAQSELNDKLKAFEAGADEFMNKPFEPAELVARLNVLIRHRQNVRLLQTEAVPSISKAHVIAVHSLRGGMGCSSISINLAIALRNVWSAPVLLIDQVLTAGQVALMLNASLKRTWADVARFKADELDWEALQSIIGRHESGIHFIAAPTYPTEAELLTPELFRAAFSLLRTNFEYILVDLPHDFSGTVTDVLDAANEIVVMIAPELASIRAAAAALDTYRKLEYPAEKVHLVLNSLFDRRGIPRKAIEKAVKRTIEAELPYAPEFFIEAINMGRPVVYANPHEKVSAEIGTLAVRLSKPGQRRLKSVD